MSRLIAAIGMLCAVWANVGRAEQGEPSPALTIYNQDFAVVRDRIPMNLDKGENRVSFGDITAYAEPESVILRDPSGKHALQVLEQNYRNDQVDENLLLNYYEGKNIEFAVEDQQGVERLVTARIIRGPDPEEHGFYSSSMLVEIDGKLRFSPPGDPVFPALSDDSILKPTMDWLIRCDRSGEFDAELSYITWRIGWKADYNIVAPQEGDRLQMVGWVTMKNLAGRDFENADIRLMAGDVNKTKPQDWDRGQNFYGGGGGGLFGNEEYEQTVNEKTFDEYHLYTLARRTTLRNRQTKQVEFVRAAGIESRLLYVYDGAKLDEDGDRYISRSNYGTQMNAKVWIMREFDNTQENHLGIALPGGLVRCYRQDGDQLEFVGENKIRHTPKDETIRIYTGNSFDMVGQRVQTAYSLDEDTHSADESFEIKVRNHKTQAVEVRVVEHMYRSVDWQITAKSQDYVQKDARTIEFAPTVPADGEVTVTYTVHYQRGSW